MLLLKINSKHEWAGDQRTPARRSEGAHTWDSCADHLERRWGTEHVERRRENAGGPCAAPLCTHPIPYTAARLVLRKRMPIPPSSAREASDFSSPLRFVGKRQERLWQKDMLSYNKNIIKIKRQRTNWENVVTINRTKGLWVKRHTLWHICPLPTRMGKGQEKKNWMEQGISVRLHSSRTN